MSNTMRDVVGRLSEITARDPINWNAFDSVLAEVEDVNIFDEDDEETILSYLIKFHRSEVLAEVIRHFLSHGYDVTANEGINGGLVLSALRWASNDHHILKAAKVLMDAGAPMNYRSIDDDEEPDGVLGDISWALSGAWMADKDFAFANVLEAYYAMAEAYLAGKDYNGVDSYFACIGQKLTSVSAVSIQKEKGISVYTEPLVLWFGDKPLVASCYTDFVVNPVYVDEKRETLKDVSSAFSKLIGSTLQEVRYLGLTACYLEFSNGKRIIFASRDIGDRKRNGTFEIRASGNTTAIDKLHIDSICGINSHTFSDAVTDYTEDALALFCGSEAYMLHIFPGPGGKYQMGLCSCARELLKEYARQYPLQNPRDIDCFYDEGSLTAVRMDFDGKYFYLKTTEYYEIELQLSAYKYDPSAYPYLPRKAGPERAGIHMEFQTRCSNGETDRKSMFDLLRKFARILNNKK